MKIHDRYRHQSSKRTICGEDNSPQNMGQFQRPKDHFKGHTCRRMDATAEHSAIVLSPYFTINRKLG